MPLTSGVSYCRTFQVALRVGKIPPSGRWVGGWGGMENFTGGFIGWWESGKEQF